jgi:hypothetical protein
MENIVTISGFRTEGNEIFEDVSDEKIKLIYLILNDEIDLERTEIFGKKKYGDNNFDDYYKKDKNSVTHKIFFGENIKRAINTLKNKT